MNTRKGLTRSEDGMIAGVMRGLAEYWNIDVTLLRIIYVLVSVFSGAFPGTLFYILMWIIIPKRKFA